MNLGALKPKNQRFLVSRYQTSGEIAGAIVKAINESLPSANLIKHHFDNKDKYESCKLIFLFCKEMIPYKKESGHRQTAKTIPRILSDANKYGGDCKHMATLSASLCKVLNIPCCLRLIAQQPGTTTPNHIYTVAKINGKDVIIDAVLKNFDTEARYNYKYDINI